MEHISTYLPQILKWKVHLGFHLALRLAWTELVAAVIASCGREGFTSRLGEAIGAFGAVPALLGPAAAPGQSPRGPLYGHIYSKGPGSTSEGQQWPHSRLGPGSRRLLMKGAALW